MGVAFLAFATLLNCGLVMMGTVGLFTALGVTAVLCLWSLSFNFGVALDRCLLAIAVAFLYISSIWFPEVSVVLLCGAALVMELMRFPRQDLALYLTVMVLYILSSDIAFYVMGDPVLEWSDAALVLTVVAVSTASLYIDYKKQGSA